MNDLLQKLEAAINERARVIEGSGYLGWLTYLMPDGSMHYTTAGSQPLDEPHWVVDGKEAVGYASAQIVHDEKREWRRLARDRKLLAMLKIDEDGDIESVEVPGETLCDDWRIRVVGHHLLRLLAEDYEIEVES